VIPDWAERALERLRLTLKSDRLTSGVVGFLFGLVISLFTTLITGPSVMTRSDLRTVLWNGSPADYCLWGSLLVLLLIPVARRFLERHRIKRGDDARLAALVTDRVDQIIAPYAGGVLAMGSALTLQIAPDLREGWCLNDVQIDYGGHSFSMPASMQVDYNSYFLQNFYKKRLFNDGDKFYIIENPPAGTDSKTLRLYLQTAKYSQVQYFRDCIAAQETHRQELIGKAVKNNTIEFPHSLCMHAVVLTQNRKVLVTRRPPALKTSYYPEAWSVSLEEQISDKDLDPGNDGAVLRWAKRMLDEELNVQPEYYEEKNLCALAVFLESTILNCSLAALLRLEITSEELDQIIRSRPRKDPEFTEWRFLTDNELAWQLLCPEFTQEPLVPNEQWHPTSMYRILLYLNHAWGVHHLAKRLYHPQASRAD
jgi:hypothetical protein